MLSHRLLMGSLLVMVLLGGAWLDGVLDVTPTPGWLSWLCRSATLPPGVVAVPMLAVVSGVCGLELARILRAEGVHSEDWVGVASALAGLLCVSLAPGAGGTGQVGLATVAMAAAVVLILSLAYYSRSQRVDGVTSAAGGALLTFVYAGVLPGFIVVLRREHDVALVVWVLLVTKSSDIGAYGFGRAFGRRQLIGWLSPGKTWEGLAGGIGTSMMVGAVSGGLLGGWMAGGGGGEGSAWSPSWVSGAFAGVMFALVGQLGDLTASVMKRDAGVKDAGGSIPGFGGMIDVVDSLLLVAPLAYWWLRWLNGGS